ncbi:uncharacterized protein KQ657_003883 [Scheffersomyces spartinae]|uniref:Pre-mRNA-splicing factor 38 n=1 Tax=Scheffersomyces spartinae TaxID=45513 RepID=A0A9P7VCT7_9ASCO|nr:uncharacterized protein KQ657_003883 [Scheffersomyces spartinae]KAG7195355.1 hypothetical protein KQ657_003883 [Scheffersomyces spartinae]
MSRQASYQDRRTVLGKAHLIEPIVRHRIHESLFYKQYLHLTNEATLMTVVDQQVQYVGGADGIGKPCPFLCCLLRMLELEPLSEMIDVYLNQLGYNLFKYLTAMALLYVRLTYSSDKVYTILDTFYTDFRKLRFLLKIPVYTATGSACHYKLSYIDELVDELICRERVCDIILPRITPRQRLVEQDQVAPRIYNIITKGENRYSKSEEYDNANDSDDKSDFMSDSD